MISSFAEKSLPDYGFFFFENYKTNSWCWELVEMTREVILTSGLVLVGQERRFSIGLALVIARMYGILFAWIKPLQAKRTD